MQHHSVFACLSVSQCGQQIAVWYMYEPLLVSHGLKLAQACSKLQVCCGKFGNDRQNN